MKVKRFARELGIEVSFSQTNHEGEYCERLHRAGESADGLVLNPGAWTHYSCAIRDALEVAGLPAVEVHLSAVDEREEWRRTSVIRDLCIGCVQGKGVDGYRDALEMLKERLRGVTPRPTGSSRCLAERELDSLLVTDLVNVRYLTGFTGTNGACVVTRGRAALLHGLPLRGAGARRRCPSSSASRPAATCSPTSRGGCAGARGSTTST